MQGVKSAVAVFCTACICAEVLSQLVGGTRMRACIKAVAGLYILVSVLRALPGLGVQAEGLTLPEIPAASFGSLADAVLPEAERQLEQELQARILEETGCEVRLAVELVQAGGAVSAAAVRVTSEQECPARQQAGITALVQQALGEVEITFVNGEDVP